MNEHRSCSQSQVRLVAYCSTPLKSLKVTSRTVRGGWCVSRYTAWTAGPLPLNPPEVRVLKYSISDFDNLRGREIFASGKGDNVQLVDAVKSIDPDIPIQLTPSFPESCSSIPLGEGSSVVTPTHMTRPTWTFITLGAILMHASVDRT